MNTIGCLLGVVPIAFIMGWAVWEVVLGSVLGILLAAALAGFLVLFDLRKPMLDWVNPIKAVKSNLNALVGMFIGMGWPLGWALIYANVRSESLWLIPAELLGAALVLGLLVGALIRRWAPRLWTRI